MSQKSAKKRKLLTIIISIIAIAAIACIILAQHHEPTTTPATFALDSEYYQTGELRNIDAATFEQLIKDKKSFVIIAHMVLCPAEAPLTTTAENFVAAKGITLYDITEQEFKQTSLHDTIKYLPSAAIYHNGELVAWLDAESDADLPAYKNADDFEKWLKQYISLSLTK